MNANEMIGRAQAALKDKFEEIDEVALFNQEKVLSAFREERIALRHFDGTTGYGYGDEGRDALGRVYARAFGAERAIVSPALLSGTHALTVALFGVLRPHSRILFMTGMPYDTLHGVVWGEGNGSLSDFGVETEVCPLNGEGKADYAAVKQALLRQKYDVVHIQRSRGYDLRDAFTVEEIGQMCAFLRANGFGGCIFVDNCYGEFVEKREPTEAGADLIVGSLIKNPDGGIAPTGGYIAGREKYVTQCEYRLTAPSVGGEIGSYAYGYRLFYQGFFLAPHTVAQTLKGGLLIGKCMEMLGYENFPKLDKPLADITRAIRFHTAEELCGFIQSVQDISPVDSFVKLEPWDMPGYDAKVIMAAGTFIAGSSIELSADAPVREPYTAYFQGGLTYEHCKLACKAVLERLL